MKFIRNIYLEGYPRLGIGISIFTQVLGLAYLKPPVHSARQRQCVDRHEVILLQSVRRFEEREVLSRNGGLVDVVKKVAAAKYVAFGFADRSLLGERAVLEVRADCLVGAKRRPRD